MLLRGGVGSGRIIKGIVEAAALVALFGLAHDEVAYIDDVAELADFARGFGAFEEFLGLLVEDVEAVPGAVEAQVGAHDAHIGAHDLVHLADALGDEHHLLGVACALVVPFGHIVAEADVGELLHGMLRCGLGVDHSLDERVGGEAVAAVEAGARTFAHGVEVADRRLGVGVHLDASAEIVGGRGHGDVVLGNVDPQREAFAVDIGEVAAGLLGVLVCDVEKYVVVAVELHLRVDGAGHHVAGRQFQALVVFLHEALAAEVAEYATVAAHGLGDEEAGTVAGMEERGGVELDELHILHRALGAVDHGDAVAGGHERIGSGLIYGAYAAGGHEGDLGEEGVDAPLGCEHICAVAGDVGGAAGDYLAKMVLGDDLDGEIMLVDVDLRAAAHGLDEALLYLIAGVVGVVEDAKFRVSPLAVEVERAVLLLVEIHAPLNELAYLGGSLSDHLLHGHRVGEVVAGHHGVVYMFLEIIHFEVGHRCHATLRESGVGLIESSFANEGHAAVFGHFESEAHAGDAGSYNEKIIFLSHSL